MRTKTLSRRTLSVTTGTGVPKRGVPAAPASAPGDPASLAGGPAGRTTKRARTRAPEGRPRKLYELRLYVAGQTPNALRALANLKRICEDHLRGRYSLEVVDLLEQPQLSRGDQILAVPTLVRKLPQPVRKIIGDLSDTERVLVGLDLRPAP